MPRSVECALHSQQLVGRARGRGAAVSGELIVTSVEIVAPIMIRALHAFRAKNPEATVRSGPQPDHPDNVVRLFFRLRTGLYAHHNYL